MPALQGDQRLARGSSGGPGDPRPSSDEPTCDVIQQSGRAPVVSVARQASAVARSRVMWMIAVSGFHPGGSHVPIQTEVPSRRRYAKPWEPSAVEIAPVNGYRRARGDGLSLGRRVSKQRDRSPKTDLVLVGAQKSSKDVGG